MKKPITMIFAVFVLVSSCQQDDEITPSNTFQDQLTILSELNQIGFDIATINLEHNLTFYGRSDTRINQSLFFNELLGDLNGQFFLAEEFVINQISSQFGEVSLSEQVAEALANKKVELSLFDIYSSEQIKLAQPFVDRLLMAEELEVVRSKAVEFQYQVVNSNLIHDEKLQLLTLSSGILGFIEFVENGGIQKINDAVGLHLSQNGIPNNRFRNCSVDTRSVLAGAVVSGFMAGGVGAKVGCSGGMVGGPIGAASGCVGGAVMGFASGFMWGVVGGTAASLLTTCFR